MFSRSSDLHGCVNMLIAIPADLDSSNFVMCSFWMLRVTNWKIYKFDLLYLSDSITVFKTFSQIEFIPNGKANFVSPIHDNHFMVNDSFLFIDWSIEQLE